jgi:hypothetical protein
MMTAAGPVWGEIAAWGLPKVPRGGRCSRTGGCCCHQLFQFLQPMCPVIAIVMYTGVTATAVPQLMCLPPTAATSLLHL